MSQPAPVEPVSGRRPGESPVGYLISSAFGRMLRGRRADEALSVGTLLPAPETIAVRSSSFAPDGPIPNAHAGKGRGANRSPQLEWSGIPAGTRQLLLVMEDPDVPLRRPIIHMAALFAPSVEGFDEGALVAGADGVRFVPSFGRIGYAGPRALPRHGAHRYHFFVFALDEAIPADAELRSIDAVVAFAKDHVIARGRVTGTQEG